MNKYLFLLVALISCNTQNFLISSTYQHWTGGRPETGSGTNYKFKLIAPDHELSFKIESLKAHQRVLKFNLSPEKYEKGDTIMIFAYKSEEDWHSNNVCEIQYQLKNKKHIFFPKKLKEIERLLYP